MTSPSNSKKKFSVLRYQRTWNRSIKGKMIASNMLMFTLTVFSISIFALMQTRLSLEQVTTEKLEQSLQLKSDSIKLWIGEIKSDMVWLTRMEGLTTKVKQLIESNRDSSEFEMLSKAITKEFQLLKATKQDWKEVLLLDRDGEVMISTNQSRLGDFRTLDKYFVEGKQRLYLQKIYPSPVTFGPTMTISAPLRNSFGDTIAVIAIHIDLLRMNEIIFEKDDPVDASESFLVDSFGALVSGKKAGQKAYIRGVRSVGIESAIAGQKGTQLYASFEGVEVIGSYAWIAEIDAGLIVEKPQSIAFAPLFNLTFNIIIFSLIILSILTALIYVFAGQISDPIRQVTQMTKQISKGIFSTRLSVESSDETGILADSVNKMSENLQRALIDLSKEKNKAVAATIAKSNFLANMSHEIRTPMNSVLGYAQLIARSSGVDSQVQEYVKRIELSGKHLLDLINTILDLSKIESGKSELNESSFDLTNLCNDLTSMFEFRCK